MKRHLFRALPVLSLFILTIVGTGCGDASNRTAANAASSALKSSGNLNANSTSRPIQAESMNIQEPERYSVTMTISAQDTTSAAPAPMSTQQLTFARFDADRRWGFLLPAPLGQVVYLEKSGLKYLVLFDRKQYFEVAPDAFGFQIGRALTPNGVVERLKSRPHEKLGLEPVNGRTAVKYRSAEPRESSPENDVIFVDQETGLPLRSELNATSSSGTKSRMIVEIRDVQLNPDRAQFDVPAGMKKVTFQEARQQVDGVATALRSFVDIINGTPASPAAITAPSGANRNAARSGR
jgi:hypothetical protein